MWLGIILGGACEIPSEEPAGFSTLLAFEVVICTPGFASLGFLHLHPMIFGPTILSHSVALCMAVCLAVSLISAY